MLLANMAVARKLQATMPDRAFLRNHPPPLEHKLIELTLKMDELGIHLDTSSAGAMHRSLQAFLHASFRGHEPTPGQFLALQALCTVPMQLAEYYCAGDDAVMHTSHFALNAPLYTHFTSPIR